MPEQREPDTISWQEAIRQLGERGEIKNPADTLLRAVLDQSVGYCPRRALSLEQASRNHLLNAETGEWRTRPSDGRPMMLRVIRSDFERHFKIHSARHVTESDQYVPEYLAMALRAIKENGISDTNQPKHETLVEWFKQQKVAGKSVSNRLAEAMATIVRRPDRMIGGAHRGRRKG